MCRALTVIGGVLVLCTVVFFRSRAPSMSRRHFVELITHQSIQRPFNVFLPSSFGWGFDYRDFWASWHATWLMFGGACCPPVVTFIHKWTNLGQGRNERHCVVLIYWILFLPTPINHPRFPTHCFVLYSSELLHSLDMCENDPVAIAQCFVDKVRGKVATVADSVVSWWRK